ncbi:hypothetical protein [Maribacter sp. 2210JD10-5]|uniref:hypothetical protein n=1 Tax=Maribacter sp. 2210JD10-5 TaxID=3386272 RepID=UPI0039BCCA23
MNELDRLLKKDISNGIPQTGLAITIAFKLSNKSFDKLQSLMGSIIEMNTNESQDDKVWEKTLPKWFVLKTKNITRDDLSTNNQLWDFGSWIDAIRQRQWKWWGIKNLNSKTVIYLETIGYPYNIDPFFYMLYSIGIELKETSILEIYPDSSNLQVV